MERNRKISVSLTFSSDPMRVGELIEENGRIYFKYFSDFLRQGLDLSPWKLPLTEQVYEADSIPFEGLFGLFDDSLPDGWGRLLLDRKLMAQGVIPQEISPLDRLTYIGKTGSGALTYEPDYDDKSTSNLPINLDLIAAETEEIYEGTSKEIIEKLFHLGGSSGGARPKILVGYNPKTGQIINSHENLPEGYEHWIIKFPSSQDFPDIANVEYAYYLMALDAGMQISPSVLLKGESGNSYFATQRFDRIGNDRLHLHSASGLLNDDFRKSSLDYGHLMDAAFTLEKDIRSYEKVLRLASFNLFTHNRDDHSKNFSFLMNSDGQWKFAPVYDLTFSSSSHGLHSTTIAGESENPGIKHLRELAGEFDVKNIEAIINQTQLISKDWLKYAKKAGVSSQTANLIARRLGEVREAALS